MESRKGIVIVVANQKGGCTKTTTTQELCVVFGMFGFKVLGIDLNGQTHFTVYSGMKVPDIDEPSIYTALTGKHPLRDCIKSTKYYDIICGSETLDLAQSAFPQADDQYRLADAVEIIREEMDYDFIIADCPPARGIMQEMAFVAGDYCIVPTVVDEGAVMATKQLGKDISLKKKRNNSHINILGILFCRYKYTNADKKSIAKLMAAAEYMDTKLFSYYIRDSIAIAESHEKMISVQEYQKDNNVAIDYRCVCYEILQRMGMDNKKLKQEVKYYL